MILLRNKTFAKIDGQKDVLESYSEGFAMEIIKICRMYYSKECQPDAIGDKNIDHWFREELSNRYLRDISSKRLPISSALLRNEDLGPNFTPTNTKRFGNTIGTNLITSNEYSFGDDFVKDSILKAEKGNKYIKYFENNQLHKNNDVVYSFRRLFKYIALSLTGKITPGQTSFWNNIDNMEPDYSKESLTKEQAAKIIAKCILVYLEEWIKILALFLKILHLNSNLFISFKGVLLFIK